jgi:signal transduction histidine kinase
MYLLYLFINQPNCYSRLLMTRCFFLLFVIFFAGVLSLFAQMNMATGLPEIRNYASSDYDAHGQNWCVTQDDRGIIYFGNGNGLLEFDGNTWRLVKTLKNVVVHSLAVDKEGRILYGSYDEFGYLSPDKSGDWRYHDYFSEYNLKDLYFDDINNIVITNEAVYYQGAFGIFIKQKTGHAIIMADKNDVFLYSVCLNKNVYVSSKVHGLLVVDGEKLIPVAGGERFSYDAIKFIVPYKDEKYLIYSSKQGFFVFDPMNRVNPFSEANEFAELIHYLQLGNIRCCTKANNGNYLFGTTRNGVIICDNKGSLLKEINQKNGLATNTVLGLCLDKQKNAWLATDNGISYIVLNSPFTYINKSQGINDYGLTIAKSPTKKGTLERFYIGLPDGLYYSTGKDYNWYFRKSNYTFRYVTNLVDLDNTNYFLSSDGIYRISDTIISPVLKTRDVSASIKKMIFHPGYVLLGDLGVRILKLKNGKWELYKELSGYKKSGLVLEEEDTTHLWEGRTGVPPDRLTIDLKKDSVTSVQSYGIEKGLPSTNYVIPQRLGNELVFLTEKGVYLFNSDTDRFMPHSINSLLKQGRVTSIAKDNVGNYYVVEDRETKMLVNIGDGQFRLIDKLFLKIRKNGIGDLFPIVITRNGKVDYELFLSYENGFINFNPSLKDSCNKPFNTLIRKVTVQLNNDSTDQIFKGNFFDAANNVSNTQSLELIPTLEYFNNAVKFVFSACFYEQPEETEYSVFLEGYDYDWSKWSKEKQKEYNNLFEGDYTFKVRSRNINGTLGSTVEYRFHVIPPWYRTIGAYVCYVVLLLGFIYFSMRVYNRKLIKDKQRLELVIKERTEEIIVQKDEIEAQSELLKSANEQLIKMDEFKESLTSMIVHDLKNPLNTIISFSESSSLNEQDNHKRNDNMQYINSSGKQMLTMVHNLLDIQKSENAMLIPDLSVTYLHRIVGDAIERVRFLLGSNHIKLVSEIDSAIMVNVDRILIGRVFVNLLVNATKFTPSNGAIYIRSELVNRSEKGLGNQVKISVSDNGQGIDPVLIDKIFDKFISSGNGKNGEHHSSGLGLPFCKVAIEAHGGQIGAVSGLTRGTTIWFTLEMVTYSTILEKTTIEKVYNEPEIELTSEEKIYLFPVAQQLEPVPFYQITQIRKILSQVDPISVATSSWSIQVEKAAFGSNELVYSELIRFVLTGSKEYTEK